jgi:hypothetical protein
LFGVSACGCSLLLRTADALWLLFWLLVAGRLCNRELHVSGIGRMVCIRSNYRRMITFRELSYGIGGKNIWGRMFGEMESKMAGMARHF